ncbi:MAG: glutathione S-transferase family protein [Bermanella sp.]
MTDIKNLLREALEVEEALNLNDQQKDCFRLWCDVNSPYSCKLRTYLNYKAIPYKRMRINLKTYYNIIPEKVGMSIMPVMLTPKGEVLQDTTPIIEELEKTHSHNACIPPDPRLAFINWLLEDFSDEYLTRFSMHYRWGNDISRYTLSHRLGRSMSYGDVNMHASKVAPMVLSRQSGFDKPLGLTTDEARESLDKQLIDLLSILDEHFCQYQFLLGDKPCVADFAMYGHLCAHMLQDPYSAEIMEQFGSRTCNWIDTISEFGDNRGFVGQTEFGGWINLDEGVPQPLKQLLSFVAKTYIPFATGTALATHEKRKDFKANIYGLETNFKTFQYRAWSFENVQNHFLKLDKSEKSFVDSLLTETQVQPSMMGNGVLHCTLFDGFTPPYIKNGIADARIAYLNEKNKTKIKANENIKVQTNTNSKNNTKQPA